MRTSETPGQASWPGVSLPMNPSAKVDAIIVERAWPGKWMYVFGEMGMRSEAIGGVTVYRVETGEVVPWPACSFGDLCDHRVVMLMPD